ncbi:Exocyst complex component SEC3A [Diplonema papillatum]|nr:Exocyst complex component SEC3A [Diplonema papillatum]
MGDRGGSTIADARSKDFQLLDRYLQEKVGEELHIAINAMQKIHRMVHASQQKNRVIAVTVGKRAGRGASLIMLKPGSGQDKPSIKISQRLAPGALRPLPGSGTGLGLYVEKDEETLSFSVATEADRAFFLSAVDKHLRQKAGGMKLQALTVLSKRQPKEKLEEKPKGLLTQEDDEALMLILTKYEKDNNSTDARQLRDKVVTLSRTLQKQNMYGIVNGEKEWGALVDQLSSMAVELSEIQARLVLYQNNLGKESRNIGSVETERVERDRQQHNLEHLSTELRGLLGELEPAEGALRVLEAGGFDPASRQATLDAIGWTSQFEKKKLWETYNVKAVHDVRGAIETAKTSLASRLQQYLAADFRSAGAHLRRLTHKRVKGRLQWRSHHVFHTQWMQLLPLVKPAIHSHYRIVMELCRVYSSEMKPSYKNEAANYYKELRSQLQKKKHKRPFMISEDKKEKPLDHLQDLNAGQQASSQYAASETLTYKSANSAPGSECGYDEANEPSHLRELGINVYRNSMGGNVSAQGSALGSQGARSSRNSLSQWSGDGGDTASQYAGSALAETDKDGKDRLLPHAALIMSITTSVELTFGEQEFVRKFFNLSADPSSGKDADMTHMLNDLFGAEGSPSQHIVVSEFNEVIKYMESRCDMMCMIPVSMVVHQLAEAMSTRSSFIHEFLTTVQAPIDGHLLTWQTRQIHDLGKYHCNIKTTAVMPCFTRFPRFISRLERMCGPIPLTASFAGVQNIIEEIVKAMKHALLRMCETDAKYGDFFFVKNASFFVEYLREKEHNASDLCQKLLCKQFEETDVWHRQRQEKEKGYVVKTLLQDAFQSLFTLVEGIEHCLMTHAAEEICLQEKYSKSTAQHMLLQTKSKSVNNQIELIYKRQLKHFFEHTTPKETSLSLLFHNVWQSVKDYIINRWVRLELIIRKCYPSLKVLSSSAEVESILENVSTKDRNHHR